MIEPLARLAPLGEEGGAGNRRIAGDGPRAGGDAHRLPAGVHLDGLDGEGGGGRHLCERGVGPTYEDYLVVPL